jgi:hypothetical protein
MDSDKLAGAVERAAQAALRRAPRSLDLGDLANNAAFHVLVAWRLLKKRRSDPLAQDFFQEILFDSPLEPHEASRGIAGYLLARRSDSFAREKPLAVRASPSRWRLGVLGAAAGLSCLAAALWLGGVSAEGAAAISCAAVLAVVLAKALIRGGKESSLGMKIARAGRTIASKHSTLASLDAEIGSALDGCGCFLVFGMGAWVAGSIGFLIFLGYMRIGSEAWGIVWSLAIPCALLVGAWRYSVRGAAELERDQLEQYLEAWRRNRQEAGAPPREAS